MPNKRGNPNWWRPMLPASVLCAEFEMQVRHLHWRPKTTSPAQMVRGEQKSILRPRMAAQSLEYFRKFRPYRRRIVLQTPRGLHRHLSLTLIRIAL
jgi:hypothetical protein